jgi:hypothetical protein
VSAMPPIADVRTIVEIRGRMGKSHFHPTNTPIVAIACGYRNKQIFL